MTEAQTKLLADCNAATGGRGLNLLNQYALEAGREAANLAHEAATLEHRQAEFKAGIVARIMEQDSLAATPADKKASQDPDYIARKDSIAAATLAAEQFRAFARYFNNRIRILTTETR